MRSQLSFEPHPFIRPPSRSRVYLCPFGGNGAAGMIRRMTIARALFIIVTRMFVTRNDGLCCDPYRSDVADGEPARSWKPGLTVTDVPDRSLPIMPNLDGKPEMPWYGFRESTTVLFSSCVRTLQCRIIPEFGSGHPWTSRISQITLVWPWYTLVWIPGAGPRYYSILIYSHRVTGCFRS